MPTKKELGIDPSLIKELFTYDPLNGGLYHRFDKTGKGSKKTTMAGCKAFTTKERKGYMNGRVTGHLIKEHRAVWAWHFGEWPSDQIDHINGIHFDNRIENLRQVDNITNCRNRNFRKNNTSGWMGVSWSKAQSAWHGKFKMDYKTYHVGFFRCPTVAYFCVKREQERRGFYPDHGNRQRAH